MSGKAIYMARLYTVYMYLYYFAYSMTPFIPGINMQSVFGYHMCILKTECIVFGMRLGPSGHIW